jgi:hypothetical protein
MTLPMLRELLVLHAPLNRQNALANIVRRREDPRVRPSEAERHDVHFFQIMVNRVSRNESFSSEMAKGAVPL